MDKIGYGKSGGWIVAVGVLFCLLAAISAQPGFLSIDCGGKSNYTDENKIQWVADANYIDDLGETADIGNATDEKAYDSRWSSLRFFPKPLKKSCYHLPVDPLVPYFLRLWFPQGNYSGVQPESNFAFSIETMGMLSMKNVLAMSESGVRAERILVSNGRVLYICLIRTSESDDPYISAIELRKLQTGMYGHAKPGTMLRTLRRIDVGGNLSVRYPQDNFDRIWGTYVNLNVSNIDFERGLLSSKDPIPINTTEDLPSTFVMQTAWALNSSVSIQLPGPSAVDWRKSLLLLYFAEIENNVDTQLAYRSFYVTINGENRSEIVTLPRNHSAVELTFLSNYSEDFQFALMTATGSRLPPIINALEYYIVYDTERATYPQDVEALHAMKSLDFRS